MITSLITWLKNLRCKLLHWRFIKITGPHCHDLELWACNRCERSWWEEVEP